MATKNIAQLAQHYADPKTARPPIVSNGLLLYTPPFPLFSNLSIDIVSRYDRLRRCITVRVV